MVWSSTHTSSNLATILGISFARLCAVIALGTVIENRVRRAVYQSSRGLPVRSLNEEVTRGCNEQMCGNYRLVR
jgi:hypothetical protein